MRLIKKDIRKRVKSKLKSYQDDIRIVSATVAVLMLSNIFSMLFASGNPNKKDKENTSISESDNVLSSKNYNGILNYDDIKLDIVHYGSKYYLMMDDNSLLKLVKQAITESKLEYVGYGASPVFSKEDKDYSQLDENLIFSLFQTETDYRLLEIKNHNGNAYDVNNYADFHGLKDGIQYNGLGMISEATLNDMITRDRQGVYSMKDANKMLINGKPKEITFNNINPYQAIINSGAKTKDEIKQVLCECIQLEAKSSYAILNRNIKDYVKRDIHEDIFRKLSSYPQMKGYTNVEIQIWFGLMSYNVGAEKIKKAIFNGDLFNIDENGDSIYNVSYAEKTIATYRQLQQGNVYICG